MKQYGHADSPLSVSAETASSQSSMKGNLPADEEAAMNPIESCTSGSTDYFATSPITMQLDKDHKPRNHESHVDDADHNQASLGVH